MRSLPSSSRSNSFSSRFSHATPAIQQLQQQVGQAQSTASQAQSTAQSALGGEKKEGAISAEEFGSLQHQVTDLKAVSGSTVEGLQATQKRVNRSGEPTGAALQGHHDHSRRLPGG